MSPRRGTMPPTINVGSGGDRFDPESDRHFRAEMQRAFQQMARVETTAPRLESLTLVQDEDGGLTATVVAGADVGSVQVEIADNENFTSPAVDSHADITEGDVQDFATSALTGSDRGKLWYARATPYSDTGASGQAGTPHLAALYVSAYVPTVQETFTRSGETVTLSLTISDPETRISSNPAFKKREGDGSLDSTWQTGWDSSSGTAGTDVTLTRSEGLSTPDGKDSEIQWRIVYTDERGQTATIANALHTSNLQEITKTLRVPFTEMQPDSDTTTWSVGDGYIYPNSTNLSQFNGSLVLPKGVVITAFRANLYEGTTADVAAAQVWKIDDSATSGSTVTLTIRPGFSGGRSNGEQTVNETVGVSSSYWVTVGLNADAIATNARFYWFEVDYTVDTYVKTY